MLGSLKPNAEWCVMEFPVKKNILYYACCEEPYVDLTYTLRIERKPLSYVFNLILPCICITILTVLSFCLPPESGNVYPTIHYSVHSLLGLFSERLYIKYLTYLYYVLSLHYLFLQQLFDFPNLYVPTHPMRCVDLKMCKYLAHAVIEVLRTQCEQQEARLRRMIMR